MTKPETIREEEMEGLFDPITIMVPDLETTNIILIGGGNVLIKPTEENKKEIIARLKNIDDQEVIIEIFDILTGAGVRFEI
jgi:hypothetical protein